MTTATEINLLSETVTHKRRYAPQDFDLLEMILKEARKNCVLHIHYSQGGRAIIEVEEKENG